MATLALAPPVPLRKPALRRVWIAIAACVAMTSCRARMETLRPVSRFPALAFCSSGCADSLELTYLGTSGVIVRSGEHALLTGPLLTNPGFPRLFWPAKTLADSGHIDSVLSVHRVDDADAILIGHSHYDHLMDVPYIARRHATRAVIYGPPTMGHILHGDPALRPNASIPGDSGRYRVIDTSHVGHHDKVGRWISPPGSPFRFMALRAEHAPNVFKYHYAEGVLSSDLDALPEKVSGWKLGESFAYVIDVLRPDGSVAFRLYYMDAISRPPLGFPPAALIGDSVRFDAVILTAGNYEQVSDYPTALVKALCPRLTVLAHWEDFFRPQTDELKVIPFLEPRELIRRVDSVIPADGIWVTPRPGVRMPLCRCR